MKYLILVLAFALMGCSVQRSLVSSDGKSTITDSNPMDTVVSISDGPGCPVSVDPYIPPASPTTGTVSLGTQKLCDANGCKEMQVTAKDVSPVDPTRCTTTLTQTKGLGFGPYMAMGAAIFSMIGLALGGF